MLPRRYTTRNLLKCNVYMSLILRGTHKANYRTCKYQSNRLNPQILKFDAALVTVHCMLRHLSLHSSDSGHPVEWEYTCTMHTHNFYKYTHCTCNHVLKTTMCKPSTQEYAIRISCGPSSATGWASDGKEAWPTSHWFWKLPHTKVHAYTSPLPAEPLHL